MNKKAFTLAEILITLGIIGIVAAITMPVLINRFQMKIFEIRFKKYYSLISNAINYFQTEDNIKCHLTRNDAYIFTYSDCEYLKNNLIEKLNLTKTNDNIDNLYKQKEDIIGGNFKNYNVCYKEMYGQNTETYRFPDGGMLITHKNYPSPLYQVYYVLDVNGLQKPNKWGYDVFILPLTLAGKKDWLDIKGTSKIFISDDFAGMKEKGGKFPSEILRNK